MDTIEYQDRRQFFRQIMSLVVGTTVLPAFAMQSVSDNKIDYALPPSNEKPWMVAYAGLNNDLPRTVLRLEGKLPKALTGTLFRNGPGQYSHGNQRYQHPFDGDGLIQKYQIGEKGITHEACFVQTEKYIVERRAKRFTRTAYGTALNEARPMTSADASNTANTSVLLHRGELLALWEGGSATRMDPESLATLGLKTWRNDYAGMPFSAHPKAEADGTLWNFGVSGFVGIMCIYRISPLGELLKAQTIKMENTVMIHDFAVTQNHLVFLLPPLVFDIDRVKAGHTIADSYVWRPELGMRVLVLDKATLDRAQWFELPPAFVFHIGNAWEKDGKIHLDYVASPSAWWVMSGATKLMQGEYQYSEAKRYMPRLAIAEFDLNSGSAVSSYIDLHAEFPTLNLRLIGQRHRKLYATARVGGSDRPGFDAIASFDRDSGKSSVFHYGDDYLVEEHLFVPRSGGTREDDGWLLGSAMDVKRKKMVLSVFDASRLADGPIVQGTMDRIAPLGLHGIYVQS